MGKESLYMWCGSQGEYGQEIIKSFSGKVQADTSEKSCSLKDVAVKSHKELIFTCKRCGKSFVRQPRLITKDAVKQNARRVFVCQECALNGFDDRDSVSLADWICTEGKRIGMASGTNIIRADDITTKSSKYYTFKCIGYKNCPGHEYRVDSICKSKKFTPPCVREERAEIEDMEFSVQDWLMAFWCYPFTYSFQKNGNTETRVWCCKLSYDYCCGKKEILQKYRYDEEASVAEIILSFKDCTEICDGFAPKDLTYRPRIICREDCEALICKNKVRECINRRKNYSWNGPKSGSQINWDRFLKQHVIDDEQYKKEVTQEFKKKIRGDKKFTARALKMIARKGKV